MKGTIKGHEGGGKGGSKLRSCGGVEVGKEGPNYLDLGRPSRENKKITGGRA